MYLINSMKSYSIENIRIQDILLMLLIKSLALTPLVLLIIPSSLSDLLIIFLISEISVPSNTAE